MLHPVLSLKLNVFPAYAFPVYAYISMRTRAYAPSLFPSYAADTALVPDNLPTVNLVDLAKRSEEMTPWGGGAYLLGEKIRF